MTDQHHRYQQSNFPRTHEAVQAVPSYSGTGRLATSYMIPPGPQESVMVPFHFPYTFNQIAQPAAVQSAWPPIHNGQTFNNLQYVSQNYVQQPTQPVIPVQSQKTHKKSGPLPLKNKFGQMINLEELAHDKPVAEVKPQQASEPSKTLVDYHLLSDDIEKPVQSSETHELEKATHIPPIDTQFNVSHVNGNKVSFVSPSMITCTSARPANKVIDKVEPEYENASEHSDPGEITGEEEETEAENEYEQNEEEYEDGEYESSEEGDTRVRYTKEEMKVLSKLEICQTRPNFFQTMPTQSRHHHHHHNRSRGHGHYHHKTIVLKSYAPVKSVSNAFKPSVLKSEKEKDKDLGRKFTSILNRLTEENLGNTVTAIQSIKMKTEEDLRLLVQILIKLATTQKKYCHIFARLCAKLKGLLKSQDDKNFESVLLSQAQELFNKSFKEIQAEINKDLDAKIAASEDETVKKLFEEDRESSINKRRDAYMCHMIFVGELYNNSLLHDVTMVRSVKKMISHFSDDTFEAFVNFISVAGKKFDENNKNALTDSFNKIDGYLDQAKYSSFMVFRYNEIKAKRERDWKEDPKLANEAENQFKSAGNNQLGPGGKRYGQMEDRNLPRRSINEGTKRSMQNKHIPASSLTLSYPQDLGNVHLGPSVNWASGAGKRGGQTSRESTTGSGGTINAWNKPLTSIVSSSGSSLGDIKSEYQSQKPSLMPLTEISTAVLNDVEARVLDLEADLRVGIPSDKALATAVGEEECSAALMVYSLLNQYYCKTAIIPNISSVLSKLFEKNNLNIPSMVSGVNKFLTLSVEEELDEECPEIWGNIGKILSGLVASGATNSSLYNISWLEQISGYLLKNDMKQAVVSIISSCMGYAVDSLSADRDQLVQRFTSSGLSWSSLLGISDEAAISKLLSRQLSKYKAEWLSDCIKSAGSGKATVTSSGKPVLSNSSSQLQANSGSRASTPLQQNFAVNGGRKGSANHDATGDQTQSSKQAYRGGQIRINDLGSQPPSSSNGSANSGLSSAGSDKSGGAQMPWSTAAGSKSSGGSGRHSGMPQSNRSDNSGSSFSNSGGGGSHRRGGGQGGGNRNSFQKGRKSSMHQN